MVLKGNAKKAVGDQPPAKNAKAANVKKNKGSDDEDYGAKGGKKGAAAANGKANGKQ